MQEVSSRTIIRKAHNKENPYAQISKALLRDKRLSNKSKGLMCYLLSLPDHWRCNIGELRKHSNDGLDSIKSTLQELESYGYIEKTRTRSAKGFFEHFGLIVHEEPIKKQPVSNSRPLPDPVGEKPLVAKPLVGNPLLIIKEIIETNIRDISNINISNIKPRAEKPTAPPHIGFKKTSGIGDDRVMQAHELSSIKKRLSAIKKSNELHVHYSTMGLDDLMEEIVFHIENRDRGRCTYARALNFAILAIKNGRWSTPKGLSKKREHAHYEKKKEDAKKYSHNEY